MGSESKAWGWTKQTISSEFYSKHELKLICGGYCSVHYHLHRSNRFILHYGAVEIIELWGPLVKRKMLDPLVPYDVPSLVPHQFLVYESGRMDEVYYPDRGGKVMDDDIVRLVEGGMTSIERFVALPMCLFK